MNIDEQAVVWWIIAFTCVFETLHSLSARAIAWLLSLLGCLLTFLSRYSDKIANIAHAFPSTIYKRSQYLKERINIPSVCNYVVCLNCLSLYKYDDCLQKRGARTVIKECTECAPSLKQPLLKEIVTSNGNRKYYPHLVYPNAHVCNFCFYGAAFISSVSSGTKHSCQTVQYYRMFTMVKYGRIFFIYKKKS